MRAIIKTKRDICAQVAVRSTSELLLDAHDADGRTTPLRCRCQVEQVTQEFVSGLSAKLPIKQIALFGNNAIFRRAWQRAGV